MKRKSKLTKHLAHHVLKRDRGLDGRYRTRVIKNKKKETNRLACRKKVKINE